VLFPSAPSALLLADRRSAVRIAQSGCSGALASWPHEGAEELKLKLRARREVEVDAVRQRAAAANQLARIQAAVVRALRVRRSGIADGFDHESGQVVAGSQGRRKAWVGRIGRGDPDGVLTRITLNTQVSVHAYNNDAHMVAADFIPPQLELVRKDRSIRTGDETVRGNEHGVCIVHLDRNQVIEKSAVRDRDVVLVEGRRGDADAKL